MTWPTGPPPMPPSGWYDDPEQPVTWRYWDGARWTEHRAPQWTPPVRDPASFSAWFDRSFACVKVTIRRVGLVLLALWALASLLTFGAGVSLFTSADGRELRDLIGLDDGFGSTTTLTDREADRAADLFGDLLVAAIPWIIVLGIVYALASAWSWAIVARVAASHSTASSQGADDGPESFVEPPAESAGEIAGAALRRVPAVIGSSMLIGVIFLGLVVASIVPVAVVAALDIGAAAVVLTVLFVAVAAIALGFWLWGRLALAPVIAALGGHGVGLGRSWTLTNGRFWYVVGRLVVAGLMAGALGQVVSLLTNFGIFLPVTVLLVLVLVVQTAVSVISTIVQVAAMVVALDQVSAAAEALGPPTGSSGPLVHA